MDFNFAVVGNIVDEDGGYTKFDALLPKIISYTPKLLVVIGDVSIGSEDSLRKSFERLSAVNSKYGIPVEVTPGAGDLVDGRLPDFYKECFGEPMAAFRFEGVNFVSLDTSSRTINSKQIDFLSRQLTSPSFVLSYSPPPVGYWNLDALKEGAEDYISLLAEKSPFVLGTFYSCVRASGEEELLDSGMKLNIPSFLIGNSGGASYEIGKFGYSKPAPNQAVVVMMRGGNLNYEFV